MIFVHDRFLAATNAHNIPTKRSAQVPCQDPSWWQTMQHMMTLGLLPSRTAAGPSCQNQHLRNFLQNKYNMRIKIQ